MRRPLCNLTTIKQEKPLINVNGRDLDQPPVKLIYHFSYYHHNSINIKLQAMPYRHSTEESNKELLYQYALTGLKSGEYSSVYSVAKTPKISEATFHNRLQGRPPRCMAHVSQQNLSDSEENTLLKWITTLT